MTPEGADAADGAQWDLSVLVDQDPPAPAAPAEPLSGAEPGSPTPWWRRPVPLLAVVVTDLLVLALVAMAFWQWQRADDLEGERTTRRDVAAAAGAFGEALLTYDHEDLNTARDRVLALSTERFAQEYTAAFTGGLATAITELEASSRASVRGVYVTEVSGGSAKAVVTLDSEVTSTAGTRRTINSYLDETLLLVDGQWKIDAVTSVAALDQETTPPDGGSPVPLPDVSTTTTLG